MLVLHTSYLNQSSLQGQKQDQVYQLIPFSLFLHQYFTCKFIFIRRSKKFSLNVWYFCIIICFLDWKLMLGILFSTALRTAASNSIGLIFTSQPNLVADFGIHPSLHENCHHQIVYSKFDLKIFYPPPYERTVWHYQQADTELIKRSLESFDWKNAFSNCNPNEQVSALTKTLLNIMSNFIPNETKTK